MNIIRRVGKKIDVDIFLRRCIVVSVGGGGGGRRPPEPRIKQSVDSDSSVYLQD